MRNQVSQLKMGTILSYVSIGIQNLIAILYTPVMLRLLGQSEYGLYQLGNSAVSYLGLLSFGFGSSYVRFYYQYRVRKDENAIRRLNSIFLLVFCTMACVCLALGGGLILSADTLFSNGLTVGEVAEIRRLMLVLVITTALTFPNIIFDCYITAHEKYIFQRILLIAVNVLNPCVTLPLLLMGYRSMSLVVANLLLSILRFAFNIYYCVKKLDMRFCFKGMELHVLKSVGAFSFYIFLNEIATQINWNVGKFILGITQNTGVVAIFSVGSQFNQYFLNMSSAVSNVFIPRINKMVAEHQSDRSLSDLFTRIGRIQYIILAGVLAGYLLYGQFFIGKWAGEGYEDAYYVGAIIMIPMLIPLIQNIGIEIQRAENKHKFRSIAYFVIALLNLVISIPLSWKFGAIGSATGTAVATLLGNILLMNWYYYRKINLDIPGFFRNMARPTLALAVAAAEGLIVKIFFAVDSWPAFILQGGMFLIVYFLCLCLFGFHKEEKEQVEQIKNRIFKR